MRFDPRAVARVVVTLVTTSTRYRCHQNTMFACGGAPRDDDARFRVTGHSEIIPKGDDRSPLG